MDYEHGGGDVAVGHIEQFAKHHRFINVKLMLMYRYLSFDRAKMHTCLHMCVFM